MPSSAGLEEAFLRRGLWAEAETMQGGWPVRKRRVSPVVETVCTWFKVGESVVSLRFVKGKEWWPMIKGREHLARVTGFLGSAGSCARDHRCPSPPDKCPSHEHFPGSPQRPLATQVVIAAWGFLEQSYFQEV